MHHRIHFSSHKHAHVLHDVAADVSTDNNLSPNFAKSEQECLDSVPNKVVMALKERQDNRTRPCSSVPRIIMVWCFFSFPLEPSLLCLFGINKLKCHSWALAKTWDVFSACSQAS